MRIINILKHVLVGLIIGAAFTLLVSYVTGCGNPQGFDVIGPQGPPGSTGPAGVTPSPIPGPSGAPGANGTIVTPVQFCPASFVSSYPNTFAEFGLCINNQMYGVYSANDGFWAYLPPGVYYSDGINASCTFTIGPNCQVSK